MKKSFVNFGNGQIEVAVESIGNDISVEVFDEQAFPELYNFSKNLTEAYKIEGFNTSMDTKIGIIRLNMTIKQGFMGTIEGIYLLKFLDAMDLLTSKS